MKKEVKIILYCVLGIILILVLCLMIWWHKHRAWEPDLLPEEELYEDTEIENTTTNIQPTKNSEQDILDDLESLFHSNDWYENVEWEYGFINTEN